MILVSFLAVVVYVWETEVLYVYEVEHCFYLSNLNRVNFKKIFDVNDPKFANYRNSKLNL